MVRYPFSCFSRLRAFFFSHTDWEILSRRPTLQNSSTRSPTSSLTEQAARVPVRRLVFSSASLGKGLLTSHRGIPDWHLFANIQTL